VCLIVRTRLVSVDFDLSRSSLEITGLWVAPSPVALAARPIVGVCAHEKAATVKFEREATWWAMARSGGV
jgi:hypothetical protein